MEFHIESRKSRGSWERNCALKPAFILEKLEELKRPVFWIDADAVLLKKPDLPSFLPYDISVRYMEVFKQDERLRLNTASLFVNYTPAARALMSEWASACDQTNPPPFLDQTSLNTLLQTHPLNVFPMPVAYCKIFDLDAFFLNDEDVIIEQTQASRRYKQTL